MKNEVTEVTENAAVCKSREETRRPIIICNYLDKCDTLADIGCDHGFCTLAALETGKCKKAVVTDISEKCLAKAQNRLRHYIDEGTVTAMCTDGLHGIDENISQVLIAGIGGREMIKIMKEGFIPKKFVLQPMKNSPELRAFLIENGCKLIVDDIFRCKGKYYFIICGERSGGDVTYNDIQLRFGRDSLTNMVFEEYAKKEIAKKEAYLAKSTSDNNAMLRRNIALLKEALL